MNIFFKLLAKPLRGFVFKKAATRLFILALENLIQVFTQVLEPKFEHLLNSIVLISVESSRVAGNVGVVMRRHVAVEQGDADRTGFRAHFFFVQKSGEMRSVRVVVAAAAETLIALGRRRRIDQL